MHLFNESILCSDTTTKVSLLRAELYSIEDNKEQAKSCYEAAITSSKSSNFIHEQGLSLELAGLHHVKIGESEPALEYFRQAKECYNEWGSEMKVDSVKQHVEKLLKNVQSES